MSDSFLFSNEWKVKNYAKAENAKLVDAVAYTDNNGTWYMELKYTYEDEAGLHERYYPKVEFPFFCGKLPPEEFSSDRFGRDKLTISLIANEVAVHRGSFCNPMSGQIVHDVCVIDNQALANRCFVLTQGSMCCFCELNEFRCPHAMNDWQKIKAVTTFMEE